MDNDDIEVVEYAVYPGEELAKVAAGIFERFACQAVADRGEAHIAVSGGSTPRALFRLLATREWQRRVPWAQIHIWWVDERAVPPDDPDSNYGVAYMLLLRYLKVSNVHRIHGEMPDPAAAANVYAAELRQEFGIPQDVWPRFDLIMLGMGADGHTASLFPGTPALADAENLVAVGHAPVHPHRRITLTLPVLNHARDVVFLVAGVDKGPALQKVFSPDLEQPALPAALVYPEEGNLLWLLDEFAATAAGLDAGS